MKAANSAITDSVFAAFLRCETKAYLLTKLPFDGNGSDSCRTLPPYDLNFYERAAKLLKTTVQDDECCSETPSLLAIKAGQFKIILNPTLASSKISTRPHALWQMPGANISPPNYLPVRFIARNKPLLEDKLLLAFDAIALSGITGNAPNSGKLICGPRLATATVPLAKFLDRTRSIIAKITKQTAQANAPQLVLNKHCPECEFQQQCRETALEQDDLSLLSNLSLKERKKQNKKGIFTVTQLSYTYRPRKRKRTGPLRPLKYNHAIKALAICKDCIHIVGAPEFKLPDNPVYLDVEGVPDCDFYYLIGLRYKIEDNYCQRSFWANDLAEEGKIWKSFLETLRGIDKPHLVHYGSYESQFLKRMRERYSVNADEATYVDHLIALSCNLISVTYAQIYFPTYSNSLKDIGRYLGFNWSETDASGLRTLEWRFEWELSGDPEIKHKLLRYNAEDCEAGQRLADMLASLCAEYVNGQPQNSIVMVDDLDADRPLQFGPLQYALPAFKGINEAAYWNYQRSRIYVRTSKQLKRVAQRDRQAARALHASKPIQVKGCRPEYCQKCGSTKLYRNGNFSHIIYDLHFSSAGVRRSVIKHCFVRYQCRNCKYGYNEET